MAGFTEFEEKSNLRFLDINKCTDQSLCGGCKVSVRFFQGGGCGSAMGFDGGYDQTISLDDGCFDHGTILHEIGHTAGLFHEHQHPDRNIVLLLGNIPADAPEHGLKVVKVPGSTDYDKYSVMHYETGDWMCVPNSDVTKFCDMGEEDNDNCKVATEADCDREASKGIGSYSVGKLSDGDTNALLLMYPETSPIGQSATKEAVPRSTENEVTEPVEEEEVEEVPATEDDVLKPVEEETQVVKDTDDDATEVTQPTERKDCQKKNRKGSKNKKRRGRNGKRRGRKGKGRKNRGPKRRSREDQNLRQ